MNRSQIELEYRIEAGRIYSDGMFYLEPIYAPFFHDLVMNGLYEDRRIGDSGVIYTIFKVFESNRKEFPELHDAEIVEHHQDVNGFVYVKPYSFAEWEQDLELSQPVLKEYSLIVRAASHEELVNLLDQYDLIQINQITDGDEIVWQK